MLEYYRPTRKERFSQFFGMDPYSGERSDSTDQPRLKFPEISVTPDEEQARHPVMRLNNLSNWLSQATGAYEVFDLTEAEKNEFYQKFSHLVALVIQGSNRNYGMQRMDFHLKGEVQEHLRNHFPPTENNSLPTYQGQPDSHRALTYAADYTLGTLGEFLEERQEATSFANNLRRYLNDLDNEMFISDGTFRPRIPLGRLKETQRVIALRGDIRRKREEEQQY